MKVVKAQLPGILIIYPNVFSDSRGLFFESFNNERYVEHGLTHGFVQDNFSRSSKGVLRGLHYQLERPQGKLVWVTKGKVWDVAVDIRPQSPTFGQKFSIELNAQELIQLYIPPGFAHGFCTLEDADFHYKCTDYYHPPSERGIRWDDPDLNIEWPISNPILSNKDRQYPLLKDVAAKDLPKFREI